ncbi:FecR domain-containing protein [Porticoccaceae bacterium]|nr:FecR domain-containing protein [Porticoccaceae bacterium]
MNNISSFPDHKAIEEEAVNWLIKLDSESSPSRQDLRELTEWLSRSPAHRQELKSLNAFWGNQVLTELMVPLGKSSQSSLSSLFIGIKRRWQFSGLVIKTSVTAAIATATLAITFSLLLLPAPIDSTNGLYVTAVGQQQSLQLADGSTVQLNTNSQVKVEYNQGYRNIHLLQGQAYFEVAKDPEHPFRVYAGNGRVQALGTAFTLYLQDSSLNVLVTEGKVALAAMGSVEPNEASSTQLPIEPYSKLSNKPSNKPPNSRSKGPTSKLSNTNTKTVVTTQMAQLDPYVNSTSKQVGTLKAGQTVTLRLAQQGDMPNNPIKAIAREELDRLQSWREGLLIFAGEPLEQVVNEISRYTTVSIEIVDPAVRNLQIGGRFKVGDLDNMFKALEANFGLKVTRLGYNRVLLAAE